MRPTLPIGRKLAIIYVTVAVPLIIVIALVHWRWYVDRTEALVVERSQVARITAISFSSYMQELGRTMTADGRYLLSSDTTPDQVANVLEGLVDDYPLAYAALIDGDGRVTASYPSHLVGANLSGNRAVQALVAGDRSFTAEPLMSTSFGSGFHLALVLSLPERRGPEPMMVVFMLTERLDQMFPLRVIAGDQNIVDANGMVVFQSASGQTKSAPASWKEMGVVAAALAGTEAASTAFVLPGSSQREIVAAVPIPEFGWAASASEDAAATLGPLRRSVAASALISLVAVLVGLAATLVIARRIVHSLSVLAERAEAVGRGEFDEPVEISSRDEVGMVAASLDRTRVNLKRYVESLSGLARSGRLLTSSLDPEKVKDAIGLSLREDFGALATWVLLYDERSDRLEWFSWSGLDPVADPAASTGAGEPAAPGDAHREPLTLGGTVAGRVFRTGQREVVQELSAEADALGIGDQPRLASAGAVVLPLALGERRLGVLGVLLGARDLSKLGRREIELLDALSSQISIAVENARLYDESRRAAELNAALADIDAVLGATFDLADVVDEVVARAARVLGCGLAFVGREDGGQWALRRVHEADIGGPPTPQVELALPSESPLAELLLRARGPVVVRDVSLDPRVQGAELERVGLGSLLAVPLLVRERALGLLVFGHDRPAGFRPADTDFASKVGATVSLALESARLFEAERAIADTLQEAVLTMPDTLPGVEFSYLYRSATEMARVGGDFYDLFALDHDRIGVVIGDVSGKGLQAATLTSLVKNTLRAYAYDGDEPARVVTKTNEVVLRSAPTGLFVTLFFGCLDIAAGTLSYCSAGHPPALLRRVRADVELLAVGSAVVGMFPEQAYVQGRASVGPGDLLVLYTDGVIEARQGGALFGESRLRRLVDSLADVDVHDVSTRLFEAVREFGRGSLSDDLALLALRVGPRPSATEMTSAPQPSTAEALVSSSGARFPGEDVG